MENIEDVQKVTINLSNESSVSNDKKYRLPNGEKELYSLIEDRINEIDNFYKKRQKSSDYSKYDDCEEYEEYEEYNTLESYDSILIDGPRGSGKTTILKSLYDIRGDEKNNINMRVLDIIDPNQLDPKTNILDIIIHLIFAKVRKTYEMHDKARFQKKKEFNELCDLRYEIVKIIFDTEKKQYENKQYETIDDKSTVTYKEIYLEKTIHKFAKYACDILSTKVLVLPIDDVDMTLVHANEIIEVLRKYLRTPRIIPVIGMDASQIYAIIKRDAFREFDLKAHHNVDDIKSDGDLGFLKKLPSEYIQKIFPTSHRISLHDMLGHFKRHNNKEIKVMFEYTIKNKETLTFDFKDLMKIIASLLLEYNYDTNKDINTSNYYHLDNYLQHKTLRSFISDARAILNSFKVTNSKSSEYLIYEIDKDKLKQHLKPYAKNYRFDKYDAAAWYWDNYISLLEKRIASHKTKHIHANIAKDVLALGYQDTFTIARSDKIYNMLHLQDFFCEKTTIVQHKENKTIKIKKTINIAGYFEFMLRTIFPSLLFEHLINNKMISWTDFPIYRLKEFARTDEYSNLVNIYDDFLIYWIRDYPYDENQNDFVLGFEIDERHTSGYRKKIFNFTTREYGNDQKYYLHPFKAYVAMSEIGQSLHDNKIVIDDDMLMTYMPKGYLTEESGRLSAIKNKIRTLDYKHKILTLEDTNFGILSCVEPAISSIKNLVTIFSKKGGIVHDNKIETYIDLSKLNSLSFSIFLNSFLINICNNYYEGNTSRLKIRKDSINIVNQEHKYMPFILDNNYIRNLHIASSIPKLSQVLSTIKIFLDIYNDDTYLFDDKNNLSIKLYNINQTSVIQRTMKKILDSKTQRESYFALFKQYLHSNDIDDIKDEKDFLKKIKKLNKASDITNKDTDISGIIKYSLRFYKIFYPLFKEYFENSKIK